MLIPKRVKRRKQHRGKMKGCAHKGNVIAYGEYGLVAEEAAWIKSNQIEAARIAMTRFIKRGGQVWIDIFPHKPIRRGGILGSGGKTGQSDVRNGGRARGYCARSDASCGAQASHQV